MIRSIADYTESHPIVIFDSGVGGLTIYKAVRALLPHWPVVYFSDNQGFPYGLKSRVYLEKRVAACMRRVELLCSPALVVIACNTASTVVLKQVRSILSCPVVGVVPAIKTAASATRNGTIGLLATPATVNRSYIRQMIMQHARHCTVLKVGSSALVFQAENMLRNKQIDRQVIDEVIGQFFRSDLAGGNGPDQIVLGCTHFPLLRRELAAAVSFYTKREVVLVDSGRSVAEQVVRLMKRLMDGAASRQSYAKQSMALFSQIDDPVDELRPALCDLGFDDICMLDVS